MKETKYIKVAEYFIDEKQFSLRGVGQFRGPKVIGLEKGRQRPTVQCFGNNDITFFAYIKYPIKCQNITHFLSSRNRRNLLHDN